MSTDIVDLAEHRRLRQQRLINRIGPEPTHEERRERLIAAWMAFADAIPLDGKGHKFCIDIDMHGEPMASTELFQEFIDAAHDIASEGYFRCEGL